MIKALLVFHAIFFAFYYGILAFRSAANKQRWRLTKLVSYSILCTVLTITVLTFFIILF